eukprot:GHVH01014599.1.p1 GENE.GHVH01014599.1~~GHVH01014599.1.p1  ORF type:complete len:248 (+),score=23.75 GHVH01014599.1:33-746(+)
MQAPIKSSILANASRVQIAPPQYSSTFIVEDQTRRIRTRAYSHSDSPSPVADVSVSTPKVSFIGTNSLSGALRQGKPVHQIPIPSRTRYRSRTPDFGRAPDSWTVGPVTWTSIEPQCPIEPVTQPPIYSYTDYSEEEEEEEEEEEILRTTAYTPPPAATAPSVQSNLRNTSQLRTPGDSLSTKADDLYRREILGTQVSRSSSGRYMPAAFAPPARTSTPDEIKGLRTIGFSMRLGEA